MLSKQEYGQLLRQQIKEREDAKKAQKRQFTPQQQNMPTPISSPQRPPPMPKTPIINSNNGKLTREQQKQILAKKMQSIQYNPFGKGGGGAPVKQNYSLENRQRSQSNQRMPQNGQMSTLQSKLERNNSFENGRNGENQPNYGYEKGRQSLPYSGDPAQMNPAYMNQMQGNQGGMNIQHKRIPTPEFMEGAYNNGQFVSPYFAPPAPYGYVAQENQINYLGKIELPPQPRASYQATYDQYSRHPEPEPNHHHQILDQYNNRQQQVRVPEKIPNNASNNHPNQPQAFKKGGRNLLIAENKAPEDIKVEQNKKLKLQQELRLQMQEVVRRKKDEERKIREQDQRLEKKNMQFLAADKKKYEEELKGKQNQAKNVAEANSVNPGQPVNVKKQKFQKIRQAVAKRQQDQRRQVSMKQKQYDHFKKSPPLQAPSPRLPTPHKHQNDLDEVTSVISNDTQQSKGFNTAISKEFFRKQRQKGKLQKFTEEMHKMRKQISNQGHQFHDEINKLQQQADRARRQKDQADGEIVRLKKELRIKMDDNNKKYLQEIYNGKVKINDPFYADEVNLEQKDNRTLKPRNSQKLILQEYQAPIMERELGEQSQFANNSDMMSLIGDSKKIPLDFAAGETTMSISKLGQLAKDSNYFNDKKGQVSPVPRRYNPKESIEEEDERAEDSRGSRRGKPKQELDMLMKSRSKSRGGWGELSSVNEDLVVQIEKMMSNKTRPKSHLSTAGQRTLYSNQNERIARNRSKFPFTSDQQMNMRHKINQLGVEQQNEGSMNSLDKLIKKYM